MTVMTSEYRLVDFETSEEQRRFRVTEDLEDEDFVSVIEVFDDGKWKMPENGYIANGLYVRTIDGSVDCERIGKPYSRS